MATDTGTVASTWTLNPNGDGSIHKRMASVLSELPAIGKDARNPNLNFNYRSIDAILNAINPLLAKHGIYLQSRVLDVRTETRPTKHGQANAAVVTMAYVFTAEDGSFATTQTVGEGQDGGDKAVSKAMTMALKTALGQTFAISTEEDPDGQAAEETTPPPKKTRATKAAPKQEEAAAASTTATAPPAPPPTEEADLGAMQGALVERIKSLTPDGRTQVRQEMANRKIPESVPELSVAQIIEIEKIVDDVEKSEPF